MNRAEQIEFIRGIMEKEYKRMTESKFNVDKQYDFQVMTLFSKAAGATPDLPVVIIWDMIREVLN